MRYDYKIEVLDQELERNFELKIDIYANDKLLKSYVNWFKASNILNLKVFLDKLEKENNVEDLIEYLEFNH